MTILPPTLESFRVYAIIDDQIHWLDHLCPLCHSLNIPLLVSHQNTYDYIKTHYFDVKTHFIPHKQLSLDFLSENVDALISSSQSTIQELSHLIKKLYQKELTYIYLPHGHSDKGFSPSYNHYLRKGHSSFYYGRKMLEDLKEQSIHSSSINFIRTGNYRKTYHEKYQPFFQQLAYNKIFSKFAKEQTTLLYAPTWNDTENLGSFYDICNPLLKNLPSYYNLIIKPHPYIEKQDPARAYLAYCQFEENPNVVVTNEFFNIYPLLEKIDVYLGDFSSIGYDSLAFDIPLFFTNTSGRNKKSDKGLQLYKAGITIPQSAFNHIFEFIENHLEENIHCYKNSRQKIYNHCFGETLSSGVIKQSLINILNPTNSVV